MIGGDVIVEQIFNLPGLGRLLMSAVSLRNYPVVSGVLFVFAIGMVFINLIVDLTYGYLDPRVAYR
jgi:peptide/nickel transport system permease protein